MKRENGDSLPKSLSGTVHEQWVRCGKARCRCRDGGRHGPYYYRFWRDQGRLRKAYVPRDHVEEVRRECEKRQQAEKFVRNNLNTCSKIGRFLREVETMLADR